MQIKIVWRWRGPSVVFETSAFLLLCFSSHKKVGKELTLCQINYHRLKRNVENFYFTFQRTLGDSTLFSCPFFCRIIPCVLWSVWCIFFFNFILTLVMRLRKVFELSNLFPIEISNYSQKQGLTANNYSSSKCNVDMTLVQIKNVIYKYAWRCKKCWNRKSIKLRIWFSNSHSPLNQLQTTRNRNAINKYVIFSRFTALILRKQIS